MVDYQQVWSASLHKGEDAWIGGLLEPFHHQSMVYVTEELPSVLKAWTKFLDTIVIP